METPKHHENYPIWVVTLSNLVSLATYGLGFYIMMRLNLIVAFFYLAFVLVLEFRLIKRHCVDCYYWGKTCGFGKGRISAWLFKKGDISKFCGKKMTWKDMIPDTLVTLIPMVAGIVMEILNLDTKLLIAIVLMILLTTFGNGFIRGNLTCKYCKQKELGCPAEKLFNKEK